jgi:hypothetical protein
MSARGMNVKFRTGGACAIRLIIETKRLRPILLNIAPSFHPDL